MCFPGPAEKCRQMIEERTSDAAGGRPSGGGGERFTVWSCMDMSYGSAACALKELVKLYMYYVRASYVHKARTEAIKSVMDHRRIEETAPRDVQELGDAAARRASAEARHVMGPTVASVWDFFEMVYVGGTTWEGLVRGVGTFLGSYFGGLALEGKLRWFGFLLGSQIGSWVGSRLGLVVYDLGVIVHYIFS